MRDGKTDERGEPFAAGTYREMPPNDMNANDIKPTVINVMPKPLSGGGTSLYFIFSRIPANAAIANAQPTPQPRP